MHEVEGRIFQAWRWALEDQPEKNTHKNKKAEGVGGYGD